MKKSDPYKRLTINQILNSVCVYMCVCGGGGVVVDNTNG